MPHDETSGPGTARVTESSRKAGWNDPQLEAQYHDLGPSAVSAAALYCNRKDLAAKRDKN